ncbi:MAG TPA: helicase-associated domain-containing protein, partial [Gemmataceae bacterium]|nr:helicase-associated domain-containing protein [Gemmataceae bacterium]
SSEAVWRLSRDRILAAVEQGLAVAELKDFLASRAQGSLPQTAEVFLDDLQDKMGQLEDLGAARLIGCKDAVVARTLASDRRLRGICQLAGERHLVFKAADEAAIRRALKELGHVLPSPR